MNSRMWRIILALIFPPLAVLDKGCGTTLVVTLLTFPLWIPGMLAAILIVLADRQPSKTVRLETPSEWQDNEKRKGVYIRLSDGEVAEVVEDDHAPLDNFKRRKH